MGCAAPAAPAPDSLRTTGGSPHRLRSLPLLLLPNAACRARLPAGAGAALPTLAPPALSAGRFAPTCALGLGCEGLRGAARAASLSPRGVPRSWTPRSAPGLGSSLMRAGAAAAAPPALRSFVAPAAARAWAFACPAASLPADGAGRSRPSFAGRGCWPCMASLPAGCRAPPASSRAGATAGARCAPLSACASLACARATQSDREGAAGSASSALLCGQVKRRVPSYAVDHPALRCAQVFALHSRTPLPVLSACQEHSLMVPQAPAACMHRARAACSNTPEPAYSRT